MLHSDITAFKCSAGRPEHPVAKTFGVPTTNFLSAVSWISAVEYLFQTGSNVDADVDIAEPVALEGLLRGPLEKDSPPQLLVEPVHQPEEIAPPPYNKPGFWCPFAEYKGKSKYPSPVWSNIWNRYTSVLVDLRRRIFSTLLGGSCAIRAKRCIPTTLFVSEINKWMTSHKYQS